MRQRPGHVHRRPPGTRHRRVLGSGIAVAVLAVVLATCAGCTSGSTTAATTPAAAATTPGTAAAGGVPLQQDYVTTIRRVLPSVVEIKTASGLGSGVVYDTAGHIVTNAHVVGTATSFQVLLAGSASPLPAKLTGSLPPDDLAVIQVTGAAHLVPAHFADSSKLQVGDIVLAMGNPLGLASSVTDGIISAVGRTVSESAEAGSPGATLPDVIQTSAAINPGNSGGALVNLADQVVGIPRWPPPTSSWAAPHPGSASPSPPASSPISPGRSSRPATSPTRTAPPSACACRPSPGPTAGPRAPASPR